MKKTMKNYELELFVNAMTEKDNFLTRTRLPHAVRQACRINLKTLSDRLNVYYEGRAEIFKAFVADGKAEEKDDKIVFKDEYINEVNEELVELANVENELELETVNKEILDTYLERNDLSMPEEDVLLFFCED